MSKPARDGWLARLKAGLSRTSSTLGSGISGIFSRGRLDDAALEALEELLIVGDMGTATAAELTAALAEEKFGKEVSEAEIRAALAERITAMTPKGVKQTDSVELIREDRDR